MTTPNKERIRLLVDALRSGNYQQGNAVLGYRDYGAGTDRFCCLGVATEVAIANGCLLTRVDGVSNGKRAFIYEDGGEEHSITRGIYLHPVVQEFYGFDTYNPRLNAGHAADLNDVQGWDFNQIAQAFEDTFLADGK